MIMATASQQIQAVMTGTPEQRVEALRQWLGYPIKQRDPEKNLFWYLRPGADDDAASETRPVAVGFYPELNEGSDPEIKAWVATKGSEVSQHFFGWFEDSNQPVMYLLLPEAQQAGRVALVLPSESRQWRQRQVLTYEWNSPALLTPLGRLQQGELELMQKVEDKPMFSVPLVEWAFYKPIATAKELAQELARVSREMEQIIAAYKESTLNEYLRNLFNSFKRELLPNLKVSSTNQKDYSFADIYAQTIAYGLFTARVFSHVRNPREDFNRQDAWDKLPETNPFLRQLFQGISEQPVEALGDDLADKISEVFSILRAAKMDAILSDFRQKMNREDIVIRFYEDFLAAYKPEMRERRGVYYTPEPVVSYMVRSVDILLKEKFEKPLGLADPEVMILDPACGTGTFLLWIFQLIHQRFEENPEALTEGLADKSWSGYVKERLLPRVFGFELLMAPYAIAHLKLGLFLEETGYQFDGGKRLGIYLADTLDEATRKSETLLDEFIAEESNLATGIKRDKPVMVVIGNPPYSISSSNKSKRIEEQMQRYKQAVRDEKNIQPLSDDYIKFICFAHHKIEITGHGILAYITNHSYINGILHRGLREELQKTFESVYVLDLHGNSLIREHVPTDLKKDENVFDIQQGVAIFAGVKYEENKNSQNSSNKQMLKFDLWGDREYKYSFMASKTIESLNWSAFQLRAPNFFFTLSMSSFEAEFVKYPCLTDIFINYSTGIETGRDESLVGFSKKDLEAIVRDLHDENILDSEIYERYGIKETSGWKVLKKRKDLLKSNIECSLFSSYCYRPFDERVIYYSDFLRRPHKDLMRHCSDSNLLLMASRQQARSGFNHAFVTRKKADCNALSLASRERNYYFPLYLRSEGDISQCEMFEFEKSINLSKNFMKMISNSLNTTFSPYSVFYYIYAILHSLEYRLRYADLLKIGFPRIPVTSNYRLFNQLSKYGEKLVKLHLLSSFQGVGSKAPIFDEKGVSTVDPGHPKYANGKVTINKRGAGFTGVSQEVWEFYIGGYQVCHKWLKDRKGRTLSDDDILHYQKIIVALQETIRIMQQIDDAIPSWPIE